MNFITQILGRKVYTIPPKEIPETKALNIRYSEEGYLTNYAFYIFKDSKFIIWDRINASSYEAAVEYFQIKYPPFKDFKIQYEESGRQLLEYFK